VIADAGGTARWLPVTGAGPLGTGSAPVLASDRLRPVDLVLLCSGGPAGRSGQTLDESLAQLARAVADARADRSAATRTAPAAHAAGPPFQVDSGADGYAAWARVCGPVELAAAGSLRSQLLIACRGGTLPLSVDLSEVTQLGGAGVRTLYQVRDQLAVYQQALSLVTAPGSVADVVLGLTGLPYAKPPPTAGLASQGDTSPASEG
jgi:hypothetical protein